MGRNFIFLNITQFLDVLNENLFRYIVIFYLIYYQGASESSFITSVTGALFILPFILFSTLGGFVADRWSKSKITVVTRFLQVLTFVAAFFFIVLGKQSLMYVALFITASFSSIFGPSKYGMIPEISLKEKLLKANSYVAALTYFGVIIGTALASVLDSISQKNFFWMGGFCIFVAVLGFLMSLFLPKMPPSNPDKKCSLFIYREIFEALKEMRQIPSMLIALFCYSYFVFIGAFIQMNIVPYTVNTLKMDAAIGGYLFLVSSLGIGVGSLMAPKITKTLRSLPFSCFGISLGLFSFFFFPLPFWLNLFWLVGLGFLGGVFLVPAQYFFMSRGKEENQGRNFGCANFFSFIAAFLAALVLYLLQPVLGVSSLDSFGWVGILNLLVAVILLFRIPRT